MKKILIFELCLLFLATNFQSDNPPGWYQQTLPVNDFVNDIFFIDTLTGWAVTDGSATTGDTSYILHTTNGGNNWIIQNSKIEKLNVIQFLDENTGYAGGGLNGTTNISFYKTTNGGSNWVNLNNLGSVIIQDLEFINEDTGWICDYAGLNAGVFKTTNGGINWTKQMNANPTNGLYSRLCFFNDNTGWVGTRNASGYLYRTTNGGTNWGLQYTFSQTIGDVYFIDNSIGLVTSGTNHRTTDGGFTWKASNDVGIKISMGTDSVGWAGINFNFIVKTTNQGITWGRQSSPIFNNSSLSSIDSVFGWAGGNGIVHTTDGGGPVTGIEQINNYIPADFHLNQNYPNPFNPATNLKFKIKNSSLVKLSVYDIGGKEVAVLVNEKLPPGEYKYKFEGDDIPSGIYFYTLFADGVRIDTKKMVLLK